LPLALAVGGNRRRLLRRATALLLLHLRLKQGLPVAISV
jgi:hypothetical protein